jgi:CheY-like chemotaxis protein
MAEERARVAQKLESIGQLTGGMAHDFNNLLAIIVGNLELVKADPHDSAVPRQLTDAIHAAHRGVGLVKSLLALASRQPLLPVTLNLWALVEHIAPLLRHALGPRIDFVLEPPLATVYVKVDEAGLEAVLLNLIVNARDAMPFGGMLTLSLVAVDGMASLSVTDTGTGMSEAVLNRATEPFFTTKVQGQGTGLGLSTAAGFAKQSGGSMKIRSTLGEGTSIDVYLPLVQAVPAEPAALSATGKALAQRPVRQAKRTVLIVDDEPALAELLMSWARVAGYTAVVVNGAHDALALLAVKAFDVLLSDIIMPGAMDGIDLAKEASVLYPDMKVVMMSGYSKETATNRGDIPWPLLVKPFREEDFHAACA